MRDRAAESIIAYMRGDIDNFALEKALVSRSTDRGFNRVSVAVWFIYDDIKRHHVHGPPAVWDFLCRCIAYLKSDLEPPPPRRTYLGKRQLAGGGLICIWLLAWRASSPGHRLPFYFAVWASSAVLVAPVYLFRRRRRRLTADSTEHENHPFPSREQREAHMPLLEGLPIPAYDPDRWNVPIRSKEAEKLIKLNSIVVLPLAIAAWAPLIALLFLLPNVEQQDE